MLTNEIKKGARIILSHTASMGQTPRWRGTILDNARGIRRLVEVEGFETEAGSVWSHDIIACKPTPENDWIAIEYTKNQIKQRQLVVAQGW